MPKLKTMLLVGGVTLATLILAGCVTLVAFIGGFVLYSKVAPVELEDSSIVNVRTVDVEVKDILTPHGPVPEGSPSEVVEGHLGQDLIRLIIPR